MYKTLREEKQVIVFHLQDALLFYPGHLFVPSSEHAKIILEAHCSQVAGEFSVENKIALL